MEGTSASIKEICNAYLELFNQNSIDFKYHLAPNSVIDWFGRTIRGANKIHDYLRYEVHNQLEHIDFLEAKQCEPIETKTSHMRTKIISNKAIDYVHPINQVPDLVPLKSYADSDVEDDAFPRCSSTLPVNCIIGTPQKADLTLPIVDLTPPASATKDTEEAVTPSSSKVTLGNDNDDAECKNLNSSHSGHFRYLKRLPTAPSTSKRMRSIGGVRTLLDDSSSDEDDDYEKIEAQYTPLRYLEVVGIMKLCPNAVKQQKSALWRDSRQIETRLRISYRRKIEDKQIQFALIIYEPINGNPACIASKRNLMSQFAKAENPDVSEEEIVIESLSSETVVADANATTILGQTEDPLGQDPEAIAMAHLRTPTKFANTPPATPKRKPRSLFKATSGLKRLNSSPSPAPTPKRSAARSLRL